MSSQSQITKVFPDQLDRDVLSIVAEYLAPATIEDVKVLWSLFPNSEAFIKAFEAILRNYYHDTVDYIAVSEILELIKLPEDTIEELLRKLYRAKFFRYLPVAEHVYRQIASVKETREIDVEVFELALEKHNFSLAMSIAKKHPDVPCKTNFLKKTHDLEGARFWTNNFLNKKYNCESYIGSVTSAILEHFEEMAYLNAREGKIQNKKDWINLMAPILRYFSNDKTSIKWITKHPELDDLFLPVIITHLDMIRGHEDAEDAEDVEDAESTKDAKNEIDDILTLIIKGSYDLKVHLEQLYELGVRKEVIEDYLERNKHNFLVKRKIEAFRR